MSADNGVYILKLKDQCRIRETKGIDRLFNSFDKPIPSRLYREFRDAEQTKDMNEAVTVAERIYKLLPYCEKGIVVIILDRTWNYYKKKAFPQNR